MAYQYAMRKADALESQGMARRAWRMRRGLDLPPDVDDIDPVELLRSFKMTQAEIAEAIGVTQAAVSRWMCGGRIYVKNIEALVKLKNEKAQH